MPRRLDSCWFCQRFSFLLIIAKQSLVNPSALGLCPPSLSIEILKSIDQRLPSSMVRTRPITRTIRTVNIPPTMLDSFMTIH